MFPTAPHTEVTAEGDIVYSEIVRENVRKLEAYVEEMASGDTVSGTVNIQKVQDDVFNLWTVVKSQLGISLEQKNRIKALHEGVVRSLHKGADTCNCIVATADPLNSNLVPDPHQMACWSQRIPDGLTSQVVWAPLCPPLCLA
jgi:hypothetical protein